MTNKQLQLKFSNIIANSNNIFDTYCLVRNIENDYKTTEFYKLFKYSVYDAFELYMKHEGKIDSIINLLQDVGEGNQLDNLLNKLNDNFDINKVMNELDPENKKLLGDLLPYIEQAK